MFTLLSHGLWGINMLRHKDPGKSLKRNEDRVYSLVLMNTEYAEMLHTWSCLKQNDTQGNLCSGVLQQGIMGSVEDGTRLNNQRS